MTKNINNEETVHTKWACFRLSVIGSLLTSPPEKGDLSNALEVLAKKQWKHPINSVPVNFSYPTIERWFYKAKKSNNPVIINIPPTRVNAPPNKASISSLRKTPIKAAGIIDKTIFNENLKDSLFLNWNIPLNISNKSLRKIIIVESAVAKCKTTVISILSRSTFSSPRIDFAISK